MGDNFQTLYDQLHLPVIVCRKTGEWPVVYMNPRATLMFAPMLSVDILKGKTTETVNLESLLRFRAREQFAILRTGVENLGHADDLVCELSTHDGKPVAAAVSATLITTKTGEYVILYILSALRGESKYAKSLSSIFNTALLSDDADTTINTLLALAGSTTGVSRTYIFEETSATMTRNTYEWCAPGIEPAIQDLQHLAKADYNYDVIVNSGMYITDDVATLPDDDREILEMQGIKALAIVTLYHQNRPIGYAGFDDCEKAHFWDGETIDFLKTVSNMLTILILRRKAEEGTRNTQDILQLISDNSEELIYANNLSDYRLRFVNKALALSLGKRPEELIGQPCYKMIQDEDAPCQFCPIPKIEWNGEDRSAVYTWEPFYQSVKKTYIAKDNIVKWTDQAPVHVQTATDISQRIEYERRLQTDSLTGVANRESGARTLTKKLAKAAGGSLCFFDIDGLKITNDTLGHAYGDELLKETLGIVVSRLNEHDYICRWGGDEFLVLFSCEIETAHDVLRDIQSRMTVYNATSNKPYTLSFSYGVVPFDGKAASLDALITEADKLMYDNKMAKRGRALRRRRDDDPTA